jgi:hypothetical protein
VLAVELAEPAPERRDVAVARGEHGPFQVALVVPDLEVEVVVLLVVVPECLSFSVLGSDRST